MAKTKEDRLKAIHETAIRQFDVIYSAVKDEREQCLQDRRFATIAGAQWEGALEEQFANKPRFEFNKINLSVVRIYNEYRNNRITVDFVSKEGGEHDRLADTLDGLYRADEQDSNADEAYDNAFDEAVTGGFGAWRLRADYEDHEDDENDYQRIFIEPIYDADQKVFFDLDAKRQDKADAGHGFVLTTMTPEAYEAEWGDDPSSWNNDIVSEYDWNAPDVVTLAEYYLIEPKRDVVYTYQDLMGEEQVRHSKSELDNDPSILEKLLATGWEQVGEKKVTRRKVHKYIMNGNRVLEDCGIIAGKCIPIVPVYGKRWFISNVERCMGHVRLAKDAQRLKNMQLSKLAETAALSSTEKPIFLNESIAPYWNEWADDNLNNYPALRVDPAFDDNGNVIAMGPVGYTKPPQIPPAMAALIQATESDMIDILGNQQAGEEVQPNISGKAVELIQNKLDMQVYIYMSNMAKAVRRSGEVWLSMAKDVLVEKGRKLKSVSKDYSTGVVELQKPVYNESGELEYENDLKDAKHDVYADVGPSSSSKRAATVRALTGMMQMTADPEALQVLSSMAMMNMEGEGIDDVRDYFRNKLLRIGAIKPTKEEAQQLSAEMASQQPDPNTVYLQAAAEEAQSKARKAEADTVLNLARAEETQAKTAETLAGIDREDRKQVLETAKAVSDAVSTQPQMSENKTEGE